jgi:general secretion pathway protein E
MIGEIRDFETAQIAIQASLTGHLVLATLHTNDAVSAVTRLTDMGVEPFLLSSSLLGVLAQRLVRKVCTACGGAGCDVCGRPATRAAPASSNCWWPTTTVQALIHSKAAESELLQPARAAACGSMREDGERLVQAGITSRAELLRVTRD